MLNFILAQTTGGDEAPAPVDSASDMEQAAEQGTTNTAELTEAAGSESETSQQVVQQTLENLQHMDAQQMPAEVQKWLDQLIEIGIDYGLKVLAALAIIFFGRIVARMIRGTVRKLLKNRRVDETIAGFICNITFVTLMIFVIIAAVNALGVQTTSFVAIIGAAGLAIGLAMQGSLSNFAAGFLIIMFRPFKSGDFIEAGGSAGIVEEIQIFTTVMKTPDNKRIIVPNSSVLGGNITNYTAEPKRRVDFVFGIGYSDDIDKARAAILAVIEADERIDKNPGPFVVVSELADSSVNFTVRVWADTSDYWGIFFDTTEKVKKTFDAQGISIPFPQRDVHIYQKSSS